jgi:hypothetical protein
MATTKNLNSYPQKYFLEGEACKHFGMKPRTLKRLLDDGKIIPGRLKVKGTNYYVIEPVEFHAWYSANILEQATNKNKFHNRKPKQNSSGVVSPTSKNNGTSALSLSNGGLSRRGNLGVMGAQVIDRKEISA